MAMGGVGGVGVEGMDGVMEDDNFIVDTLLSMGYQWDQVTEALEHLELAGNKRVEAAIDYLVRRSPPHRDQGIPVVPPITAPRIPFASSTAEDMRTRAQAKAEAEAERKKKAANATVVGTTTGDGDRLKKTNEKKSPLKEKSTKTVLSTKKVKLERKVENSKESENRMGAAASTSAAGTATANGSGDAGEGTSCGDGNNTTEIKYPETRIQVRLPSGKTITRKFQSTQTLDDVRDFILAESEEDLGTFELHTPYPRRQFEAVDYPRSLHSLDLVPSAALILYTDEVWFKNSTGVVYENGKDSSKERKREEEDKKRREEVKKNQAEVKKQLQEEIEQKEKVKKQIEDDRKRMAHRRVYDNQ